MDSPVSLPLENEDVLEATDEETGAEAMVQIACC